MESKNYIQAHIEEVKAQYINKDYIVEPIFFNYRINCKGRRFYLRIYDNNNYQIAPSFSAISRYCEPTPRHLIEWRVKMGEEKAAWFSKYSAAYGTYMHIQYGRILRGEQISLNHEILIAEMEYFSTEENDVDFKELLKWYKEEKRDIRKDLFGFVTFCKDYKLKPIAIEYPVMAKDGSVAGTLDLVCKLTIPLTKIEIKDGKEEKEVIALGDFKSGMKGFYEDNEIQLHTYKPAWEEEHPELPIALLFNYGSHNYQLPLSDRVTPYRFKDQTNSELAYKIPLWIKLFHGDIKNKPTLYTTEFKESAFISMESDLDVFEQFNPIEILTKEVEF